MRRRDLLAAVGLAAAAGCTGGGGGTTPTDDSPDSPTQSPTETPTDTPAESPTDSPTPTVPNTYVTSASLERLPDCSADEAGTVTVDAENVPLTVEGCLQGRNGCVQPALADVSVMEGRTLRVTVEAVEEGDVCTQQIVYRGYRVDVAYLDARPETVVVRHRSMGETRTVARVTLE